MQKASIGKILLALVISCVYIYLFGIVQVVHVSADNEREIEVSIPEATTSAETEKTPETTTIKLQDDKKPTLADVKAQTTATTKAETTTSTTTVKKRTPTPAADNTVIIPETTTATTTTAATTAAPETTTAERFVWSNPQGFRGQYRSIPSAPSLRWTQTKHLRKLQQALRCRNFPAALLSESSVRVPRHSC